MTSSDNPPVNPPPRAPRFEPLATFLQRVATTSNLSDEERLRTAEQAAIVLDAVYALLPHKRAMLGVDPVQQLRMLRFRLLPPTRPTTDYEFHLEMLRAFAGLRDVHTRYTLPDPFAMNAACVPIFIEAFGPETSPTYMVTARVDPKAAPEVWPALAEGECLPEIGDEVTHWNGTPIDRVVRRRAESATGSTDAAQRASALNSLTIRALATNPAPDEDHVVLTFARRGERDASCAPRRTISLFWSVFAPTDVNALRSLEREEVIGQSRAWSLDTDAEMVRRVRIDAYVSAPTELAGMAPIPVEPPYATNFRAGVLSIGHRRCGFLRIFSFGPPPKGTEQGLVDEAHRLLLKMQDDDPSHRAKELIVDIRGNSGGPIPVAERVLALLAAEPIEKERGQFRGSIQLFEWYRRAGETNEDSAEVAKSLRAAIEAGSPYTAGTPLTKCIARHGSFVGPTVLLVDGGTRSAADAFAAGFQDNAIGSILGTASTTAGAGGQVISHAQALKAFGGPKEAAPLAPLPCGIGITFAAQRLVRVRGHNGVAVEAYGVSADELHTVTETDIFRRNTDLVSKALQVLEDMALACYARHSRDGEGRTTARSRPHPEASE